MDNRHAWLRHEAHIRNLARRLVRDPNFAEDLVQETWLLAFQKSPRDLRSVRGWLEGVLRRVLRNWKRQEVRRRWRESVATRGAEEAHFENGLTAVEVQLERAMRDLDPKYRVVLSLRYLEGLGPAQIARRLDMPVETVRTRLVRGLNQLRVRLDRENADSRSAWSTVLLALARGHREPTPVPEAAAAGRSVSVAWAAMACAAAGILSFVWLGSAGTLADSVDRRPMDRYVVQDEALTPAPLDDARRALPLTGPQRVPTRTGAITVRALHQDSGAPMAGVLVLFEPRGVSDRFAVRRQLETDPEGLVRVTGLQQATWFVRPERGLPRTVFVEEFSHTRLELRVPDGVDVNGRVVLADGTPAADAAVWQNFPSYEGAWRIAARSDASGEFRLTNVGTRCSIAVTAREHAVTRAQPLYVPRPVRDGAVQLEFRAVDRGHTLRGTVRDPQGTPIQGASVVAKPLRFPAPSGIGEAGSVLPPKPVALTDASGAFELTGARARARLLIEAAGFQERFVRRLEEREECVWVADVVLEREAVLEGTVRDPAGRPVGGATVAAVGEDSQRSVRTDSRGHFRIGALSRGVTRAQVISDDPVQPGWARSEWSLESGQHTRWTPTLDPVRSIFGTAIDARGNPLAGATVTLRTASLAARLPSSPPFAGKTVWLRQVDTARDGSFAFYGCPDVPHLVELHDPFDPDSIPLAYQGEVRPDADEIVLRVEAQTARIEAELRREDGSAAAGASLFLRSHATGRGQRANADAVTGRASFDGLASGPYQLFAWFPDRSPRELEPVELLPGERRDLGRIRSLAGGSVEVELRTSEGVLPDEHALHLYRWMGWTQRSSSSEWIERDSTSARARIGPAAPGDYLLEFAADGWATAQIPVQLEAGRVERASLTIHPGARHFLALQSEGEHGRMGVDLLVRDARTEVVLRRHVSLSAVGPAITRIDFAPGKWTVEAVSTDGTSGRVEIVVTDLEDVSRPIPLVLN